MNQVSALLDKVREVCSLPSDAALGARLGVSRQVVSEWRKGNKPLSLERVAQLCAMAHLDGPAWAAAISLETASTPAERTMWRDAARRLASAAALVLLVGAAVTPALSAAKMTGLYIMSSARRTLRNVLGRDGQHTLPAPCMATIGGSI